MPPGGPPAAGSGLSDRLHDAVIVSPVRSLSLAPNNNGQVSPGGTVVYSHLLVNNGNVTEGDGVGSSVSLALTNSQPGWNAVVYYDANNSGTIDGGDSVVTSLAFVSGGGAGLAPGETIRLLVQVASPPGAPWDLRPGGRLRRPPPSRDGRCRGRSPRRGPPPRASG